MTDTKDVPKDLPLPVITNPLKYVDGSRSDYGYNMAIDMKEPFLGFTYMMLYLAEIEDPVTMWEQYYEQKVRWGFKLDNYRPNANTAYNDWKKMRGCQEWKRTPADTKILDERAKVQREATDKEVKCMHFARVNLMLVQKALIEQKCMAELQKALPNAKLELVSEGIAVTGPDGKKSLMTFD